jgi:O-antigen biosynthesis protein WbqV
VSPLFEAQLAAGGPLTVTDAEVTRYFLSIPQAADTLLHAAAVALAAKQRGATFVIEMGEALPVVELARAVIRLEGKRPDLDVPIVFTGLRPGEKLHEQLIGSDELADASVCKGVIAAISEPRAFGELSDVMERVTLMARQGADAAVAEALFAAVASPRVTERAVAV